MKWYLVFSVVLAGLALPSSARADTVVLADGSYVYGEVRVVSGRVMIRTADATLNLPVRRVRDVVPGHLPRPKQPEPAEVEAPTPAPRQPAQSVATPPAGQPAPAAAQSRQGPPVLTQALAEVIDVSFDGAAPTEVFEFVRTITGINLVLDNDVRRDQQPVYINLRGVSVAKVLDVLRELNGYVYEVRPGQILFVRMQRPGAGYMVRIYPVKDILVSTEDTGQGGDSGGRGRSNSSSGLGGRSNSSRSSGLGGDYSSQFSGPLPAVSAIRGTGADVPEFYARSQDLIQLMQQSCGAGTWQTAAPTGP